MIKINENVCIMKLIYVYVGSSDEVNKFKATCENNLSILCSFFFSFFAEIFKKLDIKYTSKYFKLLISVYKEYYI